MYPHPFPENLARIIYVLINLVRNLSMAWFVVVSICKHISIFHSHLLEVDLSDQQIDKKLFMITISVISTLTIIEHGILSQFQHFPVYILLLGSSEIVKKSKMPAVSMILFALSIFFVTFTNIQIRRKGLRKVGNSSNQTKSTKQFLKHVAIVGICVAFLAITKVFMIGLKANFASLFSGIILVAATGILAPMIFIYYSNENMKNFIIKKVKSQKR